jgi:hypothetical protein
MSEAISFLGQYDKKMSGARLSAKVKGTPVVEHLAKTSCRGKMTLING